MLQAVFLPKVPYRVVLLEDERVLMVQPDSDTLGYRLVVFVAEQKVERQDVVRRLLMSIQDEAWRLRAPIALHVRFVRTGDLCG